MCEISESELQQPDWTINDRREIGLPFIIIMEDPEIEQKQNFLRS